MHGSIVHHHREFIGRDPILAPDEEIAKIAEAFNGAGSEAQIVKFEGAVIRDTETPVVGAGVIQFFSGSRRRAPMLGVKGFVLILGMGSLAGAGAIAARFITGINATAVC